MRETPELSINKVPFLLGDVAFLGAAYFIYLQSKLPMGAWQIFFVVLCVAGGAWLMIMPFLLEYRLNVKMTETHLLATTVGKIQNLEQVANQVTAATAQWQSVQDQAEKTAVGAAAVATKMASEAKAFSDFLSRANDGEKGNLRLEVEKLRRAEKEWVHVLVRILDHIYVLNQGALRSGQPRLIEQIGSFQAACRDSARRVGLNPFTASPEERFDPQKHQLVNADSAAAPDAVISETVAAGYTFQGALIRPALVQLRDPGTGETPATAPGRSASAQGQSQLSLDDRLKPSAA